jgi:hypothetical protein
MAVDAIVSFKGAQTCVLSLSGCVCVGTRASVHGRVRGQGER